MSFLFSFLSFFFKLRERERERGYTKFGIRRNSPKGTYLISLMEFLGESFFFYGLIDFMLFLILAWRTWVPRVRDIFLSSSPGSTGFWSVCHKPCPITNFLIFYFRWREGVPTSVLGSQPIVWLLPFSFPYQAIRVRSPSINICGSPLCDLHSFLTVTLWWPATVNSNTGKSINLISIVSVGHHVTIYIYREREGKRQRVGERVSTFFP